MPEARRERDRAHRAGAPVAERGGCVSLVTFGTWVSPPDVIPFTERPEPPGELREEDAAKVPAVFCELGVLAP